LLLEEVAVRGVNGAGGVLLPLVVMGQWVVEQRELVGHRRGKGRGEHFVGGGRYGHAF